MKFSVHIKVNEKFFTHMTRMLVLVYSEVLSYGVYSDRMITSPVSSECSHS